MRQSNHRTCKCGAVYDRSDHIVKEREISSFECAVCGATIENWNSAWVPRYRFIACAARTPNYAKSIVDIATGQKPDRDSTPEEQGKDPAAAELGADSHLVGHLSDAKGSMKRLDRSTDRLFPASNA